MLGLVVAAEEQEHLVAVGVEEDAKTVKVAQKEPGGSEAPSATTERA
jgi:hypothetical protein